MLVDCDDDSRRMYAEYLQLSGCIVEESADGREALAKAVSRHPDIVITETRLPGIDGVQLFRLLHEDAATRSIPFIFVTAYAPTRDLDRARAAGAGAVLVKPCRPARVLLELRRVLARSDELRMRVGNADDTARAGVERASAPVDETRRLRQQPLSRTAPRFETKDPPAPPPALVCPACDQPLRYDHSNVGGVNARHVEQWDYYECAAGCGTFQHRQRTRKLRRVI